jgi:hypothetical protein
MRHNIFGLGKGGDFTTNVDAETTLQIYEKLSCQPLNRPLLQTHVMPSAYSHSISILSISFVNLSVSDNATIIFLIV